MKLERVIKDGSAFNLFVKMVEAQSGDISYILNPDKFIVADKIIPVLQTSGYIKTIGFRYRCFFYAFRWRKSNN